MERLLELIVPAAMAHEKWFVGEAAASAPELFRTVNVWTVAAVASLAVCIAVGRRLDRRFLVSSLNARLDRRLRTLRDLAPTLLSAATGITLLWYANKGMLLADNFMIPEGLPFGGLIRFAEGAVGLLLLGGLYVPYASAGLFIMYGAAVGMFGIPDGLDYLHYAGIALFLIAFSPGRFSADWFLGRDSIATERERRAAYPALRYLTGAMFVILALGKLVEPGLHLALLQAYPDFNPYVILTSIGLTFSPDRYVFCLFVVELLAGTAVLFGYATRMVAIALVPIMAASVVFLGFTEIFGHLPIIGILLVLIAYGEGFRAQSAASAGGGTRPQRG